MHDRINVVACLFCMLFCILLMFTVDLYVCMYVGVCINVDWYIYLYHNIIIYYYIIYDCMYIRTYILLLVKSVNFLCEIFTIRAVNVFNNNNIIKFNTVILL